MGKIRDFFKALGQAVDEWADESQREYHIQEEKLWCPYCGASFTNVDWFNAHLINDHKPKQ